MKIIIQGLEILTISPQMYPSHMLIELCSVFKDSDDLMIFKDLAMIVLSFAGFLRFDELNSLKCNDVSLFMIIC
jgi:site-specific recombinase XerC